MESARSGLIGAVGFGAAATGMPMQEAPRGPHPLPRQPLTTEIVQLVEEVATLEAAAVEFAQRLGVPPPQPALTERGGDEAGRAPSIRTVVDVLRARLCACRTVLVNAIETL